MCLYYTYSLQLLFVFACCVAFVIQLIQIISIITKNETKPNEPPIRLLVHDVNNHHLFSPFHLFLVFRKYFLRRRFLYRGDERRVKCDFGTPFQIQCGPKWHHKSTKWRQMSQVSRKPVRVFCVTETEWCARRCPKRARPHFDWFLMDSGTLQASLFKISDELSFFK